ncbi:MAG: DUF4339 domain-containing protein [Solobacterium sp.]|nr:DUF4339 domain-containing protein [Solobacterium sp.]
MNKIWYYTKGDGNKFGPFTDEELIKLLKQEILTVDDYIWMMDLDEWIKIGDTIYSEYCKKDESLLN